jgi:hypothetical protein
MKEITTNVTNNISRIHLKQDECFVYLDLTLSQVNTTQTLNFDIILPTSEPRKTQSV